MGRAPRAHEWTSNGIGAGAARWLSEHPRWPSAGTVVYHYGSWSRALEAAGLPSLFVEHELPRRERVATAVALRAAGETVASIADQLGVHPRTVHRYLAAGACRACGGPALYGEHCRECFPRHGPAATKPELVRALRAWTAEHGQPPREQDWRGSSPVWAAAWPRWPGTATVLRVFAGWNAALEAAGLPTHRYAWDPDEALEALAAWARAHGRPPSIADARHDRGLPSPATYQDLHGSWNAALRAAGLTPSREAQWDDEHVHATLARWARWHTQHESGEPSAASYRHWAARQPGPGPLGVLDPAPLRRLLERRPRRRRPPRLPRWTAPRKLITAARGRASRRPNTPRNTIRRVNGEVYEPKRFPRHGPGAPQQSRTSVGDGQSIPGGTAVPGGMCQRNRSSTSTRSARLVACLVLTRSRADPEG